MPQVGGDVIKCRRALQVPLRRLKSGTCAYRPPCTRIRSSPPKSPLPTTRSSMDQSRLYALYALACVGEACPCRAHSSRQCDRSVQVTRSHLNVFPAFDRVGIAGVLPCDYVSQLISIPLSSLSLELGHFTQYDTQ